MVWAAQAGGAAWRWAAPERRRVAEAQLEAALPEVDAQATTRAMFEHLVLTGLELARFDPAVVRPLPATSTPWGGGVLHVEGREHVLEALAQGGVFLLGAHLGAFELALQAEAAAGLPITVLTKRLRPTWLDDLWRARRAEAGLRLLDDDQALDGVRRALRARRCVAVALDQHANPEHAAPTTFFQREAATLRSVEALSRRWHVPVIPAFTRRIRPGEHLLRYQPPLLGGDTQRFTSLIEDAIREAPAQWTWLHRRWKGLTPREPRRSPSGSPGPPGW